MPRSLASLRWACSAKPNRRLKGGLNYPKLALFLLYWWWTACFLFWAPFFLLSRQKQQLTAQIVVIIIIIIIIRTLLSFEILRSVHTCVRGSRTPFHKIARGDFIDDCCFQYHVYFIKISVYDGGMWIGDDMMIMNAA